MHVILTATVLCICASALWLRWQYTLGMINLSFMGAFDWFSAEPGKAPLAGGQSAPLKQIDDPAVLAALLAVSVLAEGPELSPQGKAHLRHALRWHIAMTGPEVKDLLDLAGGLLSSARRPQDVARLVTRRLVASAGPTALAAPLCVIEDVAATMGGFNTAQGRAVRALRHHLGA